MNFLTAGASKEKAKATLKDAKVLEPYTELESLPDTGKNIILKVVDALVYDYKIRKAYAK
jgi:hypothetical protein